MPSIKFTEAELEFLVGQYELELIEAEKYIGEIKNILKKLGVISKDTTGKNEIKKKRGRGRPSKEAIAESSLSAAEKSAEPAKKKKGKPGRPGKKGRKKGSKREKVILAKPADVTPPAAKVEESKPAPKPVAKKTGKKIKPAKKSTADKKKITKSAKVSGSVEAPAEVIDTPPSLPKEE